LTELIIFALLLGFIGYLVYAKIQRDNREFSHIYRPADEHALDSGEFGTVIAFEGNESFETEEFPLKAGEYKLAYWFPEGVMVKVELFSANGVDSEVIALKSGEGATTFSVAADGRYFCMIDPAEDEAEWEIEISRLGLPSGYKPDIP